MNTPPAADPDDDETLAAALRASRVLQDAPEALVQRAIGLWQAPAAVPASAAAGTSGPVAALRRLVATLVFDSLDHGALAAGRRSAATLGHLAARQLLFSTEGRDIDLRLTPLDGGTRWVLSGQVLGPELSGSAELRLPPRSAEAPADINASTTAAPAQVVAWNELAEFEFAPIGAGPCSLVLSAADWTVELGLFVRAAP